VKQPFRLAAGGAIDRGRRLAFSYDGRRYQGFAGDTLASALLANGVHLVARSFKYHRPRGIFSAGAEEPNALVQLGSGARSEPNVRATTLELYEGLTAASQNCWPSVRFDAGAIASAASRLIPAGFYYKTFMWPPSPRWWLRYEHFIRRAAGMGRAADAPDPDCYEQQYAHCDVLVVGGGPAGRAAARAALQAGERVILCDENPPRDGLEGAILLTRTTAFGYYDGNLIGAIERLTDHLAEAPANAPRQRLWKIRAQKVVLATGAIERGIAYVNNDLPGTMLAGAARTYVERFAVRPGRRAVVFTNNDSGRAAAEVLRSAGVEIAALVDAREGQAIIAAHGRLRVAAVDVAPLAGGKATRLECDLVCVSGGFNPAVHLFCQARGKLAYDEAAATFVPDASPLPVSAAGDAARIVAPLVPLWAVPAPHKGAKRFVDLQNDVTVDDIALAAREGYRAVEHLKRYTTLGMGTDQGKTSNIVGLGVLAGELGVPLPRVGTTTFRPPYTPVTLGAIPGQEVGGHIEPTRYSAMHDWHAAQGARFVNAGLWKRPHSYPRSGESEDQAASREARNVRANVGVVDVSTLGKIELQGRDVAELLNRVYVNRWDTLAVGRCRYGVMLREDGMVMDDGTTSRLAPAHFLMTTTTVNAVRVLQQLEQALQVEWRELDAYVTSVTEQWAALALSGPKAREVLAALVDTDVSNAALPFLAVAECRVHGIPGRVFRMSYSGELAYEIHVPADQGRAVWEAVIAAGEPHGIMPYGTEAMSTLRIEKGHVVIGAEADGRTTADDLGMGKLISSGKWCIGKPLLDRPALREPGRWQLVGLTALDDLPMPRAAKLVANPDRTAPNPMLGHVTSWCYSPNLNAWIALALLADGRTRHGETLWAVSPLANARVRVKVGPPCFIDHGGERMRA
jgi:glycine cleavage system aminomethyltransferase T/NADPH-dependent 2,4-dienoyl-CoA reductase/sulfur reductase-like enzyme